MEEHLPPKREVVGSIPTENTKEKSINTMEHVARDGRAPCKNEFEEGSYKEN